MHPRYHFLLVFTFLFLCSTKIVAEQRNSFNIITPGSYLSTTNISNYWTSNSGQFAFGFYPKENGFAVGIWYAKIQHKTIVHDNVVWTANRDDPPLPIHTKLVFTSEGRLILQTQKSPERLIANTPLLASSALLLDSGNFVLHDSNLSVIWESFDFPTDTLLPHQQLRVRQKLISSLSEADHSSGKFRLEMQTDQNLVQYPADGPSEAENAYWSSNTYDPGYHNTSLNFNETGALYLLNGTGFIIRYFSYGSLSEKRRLYRLTIDIDGFLRLYYLESEMSNWRIEWSANEDKCDPKGLCGPNEYCSVKDDKAVCTCLLGFDKIDQEDHKKRNLGCKRKLNLISSNCSENDVLEPGDIIWVDDSYSMLENVDKDTCRLECSRDCNCEAALYMGQVCRKQTLPLRFGKVKQADQEVIALLKVGSGNIQTTTTTAWKETPNQTYKIVIILGLTLSFAVVLVVTLCGILIFRFRVREFKCRSSQVDDDIMLRSFKYSDLEEATNGFAEEVGRGAFGTVFKGVLTKGMSKTVIAVKRLKIEVSDGEREFQNEVKIIGRTHHRNLVQLLGYCHEGTNRLLVYEYMSNGSLANFLFKSSEEENSKPRWEERIRIALDIARGIVYLHEECKTQIIHCDIKPENILMDENGRAKISDFGVSKLLMPYQSKTTTGILRGTRGYVAPEWHMNMPITTKADVYSFGVMLLEIVCCRRSWDIDAEMEKVLSDWVYGCFEANQVEKVVGRLGEEVVDKLEVERVIKVGLWCIQNEQSLRPLMKHVVLMLEGTVEIPVPPNPAIFLTPYFSLQSTALSSNFASLDV